MATQRRDDLSCADLTELLREVAQRLGKDTVTRAEFRREADVTEWQVMKRFDSWNDFVVAAGLRPYVGNRRLSDDDLFAAMRDAFVAGGGILTRLRLRKLGRHGDDVYVKRLGGGWTNVLTKFREWVIENDPAFPYLNDLPASDAPAVVLHAESATVPRTRAWSPASPTRTRYGPFLNFRGLQHAPINEQGVVFLFGMVAFDLGYVVEGVGVGFPDCEAKRCVSKGGDVWERVRIEFEYRSRNFLEHGHVAADCDVLICWSTIGRVVRSRFSNFVRRSSR